MKRVILLVAIIAIAGFGVGFSIACGGSTSNATPTPLLTPTPIANGHKPPPETNTWLSPGKVQIGNFYPGARAEWPITIHYGATDTSYYTCVTGQQTTDFLILDKPLYLGILDSIQAFESDNGNDTLTVDRYETSTRTLYFSGLVPNTTRKLIITYSHSLPGQFEVYYKRVGSNVLDEGFSPAPIEAQDWVIVADPTPLMMPFDTRVILITVSMPKGASAPDRWEFQIAITNRSIGGQVTVEMASRWMVTMR